MKWPWHRVRESEEQRFLTTPSRSKLVRRAQALVRQGHPLREALELAWQEDLAATRKWWNELGLPREPLDVPRSMRAAAGMMTPEDAAALFDNGTT